MRPAASADRPHPPIDECWTRVGVRGDKSCPELKQHVHCRNCPVYSKAARALLDRDTPADYREDWTRHFQQKKLISEAGAQSLVVFRVGAEWLGLPAAILIVVAEQRAIHSLPHRRAGPVLGVTNLRGELVVCVSLAKLLKLEEAAPTSSKTARGRLLLVGRDGCRVVFPADEVHGVLRYQPHDLKSVPATLAKAAAGHTTAMLSWGDRTVGCLDDALVFQTLARCMA